ncbi:MAG: GGDEF domain-containing protein [Proteobacteria bacterium]|nr:GGDEF domain-containing protein [Pseudomonadota bacterium]
MNPQATEIEPKINGVLRAMCVAIGCATALIGGAALLGEFLHQGQVGHTAVRLTVIKPNVAAAILALGIALALTVSELGLRAIPDLIASLVLTVGLVTLSEYALNWDAGIDRALLSDSTSPAALTARPALAAALMITMVSAALLGAQRPRLRLLKTCAGVASVLVAWVTLIAYLFGAQQLHEGASFSPATLPTAAIMLFIGIGVLAAEPVSWPINTVLARSTGSIVCRWLLPPAILAPPLLGWLLSRQAPFDLFPEALDWALYAAASSIGSVWLILQLAQRITLIDAARTAATELSQHDPLTGLANRRAFDAFLLENFNLARRHGHALSLVLLDIDLFKSYNDAYGHPAGDELLKSLGALLASLVRETDLVARIGGEEFALVLPETGFAGAVVLAECIRMEVERSSAFRRKVTVSAGLVAMAQNTGSIAALVQECDAALYRAKEAGRNQVWAAGESGYGQLSAAPFPHS